VSDALSLTTDVLVIAIDLTVAKSKTEETKS
jgi:hypothetical protein